MQMLLATLQLGGSGATMQPPGPEIARRVIDAFLAKDVNRAAELQLQFALFPSKWMRANSPFQNTGKGAATTGARPESVAISLATADRFSFACYLR
jgi:hypothetical protein